MRYSLILFFCFIQLGIFAQKVSDLKITYANSDASLEEIFTDLESQYGIRFSYATTSIEDKMMSANFNEESIGEVLAYLLSDEEMEYKIVNNNILLRKSESYIENKDSDYKSSLHLKGKIINGKSSDEILEYATISISNTNIGTYSDDEGRFDIEIPEEYLNENIIIQYLGYENEVYKISELEDQYILVSMEDGQFSFEEVMIVNKEKPINLGNINNSIQLNTTQISSSTSGVMGGDIGRQIQMLPGITAHDDNSAAIKIRGSNSDETLMILDGMPIYNANHYYGIFSGVNTSYIDSVNIFKNIYPLQYGGKTAGLVEMFSDNKQVKKTETAFNLDFLTASVLTKIPLSTNSQLTIAGRSTFKEINNQQFNTTRTKLDEDSLVQEFNRSLKNRRSDPSFTFYDMNVKYQWKNQNNDNFSINLFRSSDQVDNNYKISFMDPKENEVKSVVQEDQSWSNTAASIMMSKNINPQLRLNSTAYFTQYKNEDINEIKLDKKYKQGSPPPPLDNPIAFDLNSEQKNEITDVSLDSHLDYYTNGQSIKVGLAATQHYINYLFQDNSIGKLQGKDDFFEASGYLSHHFQLWDKINLNSGIRATYYSNIKEMKYSPRFLLNYQASNQVSLKASYSIENQVIRQFNYEYRGEPMELWVTAGQNDIPVLRSQNIMVGSTIKTNYFTIDVELFQKDMNGVLEYLLPNPGEASNNPNQDREYKLFRGNGLNKGIDIILSSGYKKYDTYLSYTLSKSDQQFKEIFMNEFFASENDRRHQLKWVNTLSAGKFTFGMNAIYVSGRPYTDIRIFNPDGDIRDLDPKTRLNKLKPYHRIDISCAYAFKIGQFDANFTASVFNLMNYKNVKYIQAISTNVNAEQKVENVIIGNESELLNRTVNLGFQINF